MKVKILLTNKEEEVVELEKVEYLLGMTAFMCKEDIEQGVKAINPLTKEKVKVLKGNQNRIIVPAHNKEDYELAKKNNLQIKQVVAPYFAGYGNEKVKENMPVQRRKSVIAILSNMKKDKILCLDCKGRTTRSFILGGIEEGETPEEAAIRETREETGYIDVKINFTSNYRVIRHFYADYKGVNRYAYLNILFLSLNSEKREEMSENEKTKHIPIWIEKDKVRNFITIDNNKYAFDMYLNGEKPYLDNGNIIIEGEYEGMTDIEARDIISKKI